MGAAWQENQGGAGLQMCQFSSQRGGLLCRAAAMSLYICQHADASRRRKADRDKPLNLSQVRAVIHCVECRRPRCIFSARRPSSSDRAALEAFVANATYTCGDALSMDTFIVRKSLSCTDPVEAFYFLCCRSRGGMEFESICVWCALTPSESPHVDKAAFDVPRGKEPLPICAACHDLGFMPRMAKAASNHGAPPPGADDSADSWED